MEKKSVTYKNGKIYWKFDAVKLAEIPEKEERFTIVINKHEEL